MTIHITLEDEWGVLKPDGVLHRIHPHDAEFVGQTPEELARTIAPRMNGRIVKIHTTLEPTDRP